MRNWKGTVKNWLVSNAGVLTVVAFVWGVDRISKIAAQRVLWENPIPVFPFFHLHYVENTGASFGMFQGGNTLLVFITAAIIVYLLYSWKDLCAQGPWAKWGGVLILAGALGNLYDRIALGYVVDFLDFLVWPVFNVADTAICVGAGLMVLSLFWGHKKREEV